MISISCIRQLLPRPEGTFNISMLDSGDDMNDQDLGELTGVPMTKTQHQEAATGAVLSDEGSQNDLLGDLQ